MFNDEEEEDNTFGVTRYPCMPSLVALQQMRNRLHLANLGKKLMKWTAQATGTELRNIAGQLDKIYQSFSEDMHNAYILLARCRYFYPNLNKMVLEGCPKVAEIFLVLSTKTAAGVKKIRYEIIENNTHPYAHLGIEKGGQTITDTKKAWLELLKRIITMSEFRTNFRLVESMHKAANKKWNVLSKMVAPRITLSTRYILSELEEIEREDNFRLKRFKELKIKKKCKDSVDKCDVTQKENKAETQKKNVGVEIKETNDGSMQQTDGNKYKEKKNGETCSSRLNLPTEDHKKSKSVVDQLPDTYFQDIMSHADEIINLSKRNNSCDAKVLAINDELKLILNKLLMDRECEYCKQGNQMNEKNITRHTHHSYDSSANTSVLGSDVSIPQSIFNMNSHDHKNLGHFKRKYKETIEVLRLLNEDGTIKEKKKKVIVKMDSRIPIKAKLLNENVKKNSYCSCRKFDSESEDSMKDFNNTQRKFNYRENDSRIHAEDKKKNNIHCNTKSVPVCCNNHWNKAKLRQYMSADDVKINTSSDKITCCCTSDVIMNSTVKNNSSDMLQNINVNRLQKNMFQDSTQGEKKYDDHDLCNLNKVISHNNFYKASQIVPKTNFEEVCTCDYDVISEKIIDESYRASNTADVEENAANNILTKAVDICYPKTNVEEVCTCDYDLVSEKIVDESYRASNAAEAEEDPANIILTKAVDTFYPNTNFEKVCIWDYDLISEKMVDESYLASKTADTEGDDANNILIEAVNICCPKTNFEEVCKCDYDLISEKIVDESNLASNTAEFEGDAANNIITNAVDICYPKTNVEEVCTCNYDLISEKIVDESNLASNTADVEGDAANNIITNAVDICYPKTNVEEVCTCDYDLISEKIVDESYRASNIADAEEDAANNILTKSVDKYFPKINFEEVCTCDYDLISEKIVDESYWASNTAVSEEDTANNILNKAVDISFPKTNFEEVCTCDYDLISEKTVDESYRASKTSDAEGDAANNIFTKAVDISYPKTNFEEVCTCDYNLILEKTVDESYRASNTADAEEDDANNVLTKAVDMCYPKTSFEEVFTCDCNLISRKIVDETYRDSNNADAEDDSVNNILTKAVDTRYPKTNVEGVCTCDYDLISEKMVGESYRDSNTAYAKEGAVNNILTKSVDICYSKSNFEEVCTCDYDLISEKIVDESYRASNTADAKEDAVNNITIKAVNICYPKTNFEEVCTCDYDLVSEKIVDESYRTSKTADAEGDAANNIVTKAVDICYAKTNFEEVCNCDYDLISEKIIDESYWASSTAGTKEDAAIFQNTKNGISENDSYTISYPNTSSWYKRMEIESIIKKACLHINNFPYLLSKCISAKSAKKTTKLDSETYPGDIIVSLSFQGRNCDKLGIINVSKLPLASSVNVNVFCLPRNIFQEPKDVCCVDQTNTFSHLVMSKENIGTITWNPNPKSTIEDIFDKGNQVVHKENKAIQAMAVRGLNDICDINYIFNGIDQKSTRVQKSTCLQLPEFAYIFSKISDVKHKVEDSSRIINTCLKGFNNNTTNFPYIFSRYNQMKIESLLANACSYVVSFPYLFTNINNKNKENIQDNVKLTNIKLLFSDDYNSTNVRKDKEENNVSYIFSKVKPSSSLNEFNSTKHVSIIQSECFINNIDKCVTLSNVLFTNSKGDQYLNPADYIRCQEIDNLFKVSCNRNSILNSGFEYILERVQSKGKNQDNLGYIFSKVKQFSRNLNEMKCPTNVNMRIKDSIHDFQKEVLRTHEWHDHTFNYHEFNKLDTSIFDKVDNNSSNLIKCYGVNNYTTKYAYIFDKVLKVSPPMYALNNIEIESMFKDTCKSFIEFPYNHNKNELSSSRKEIDKLFKNSCKVNIDLKFKYDYVFKKVLKINNTETKKLNRNPKYMEKSIKRASLSCCSFTDYSMKLLGTISNEAQGVLIQFPRSTSGSCSTGIEFMVKTNYACKKSLPLTSQSHITKSVVSWKGSRNVNIESTNDQFTVKSKSFPSQVNITVDVAMNAAKKESMKDLENISLIRQMLSTVKTVYVPLDKSITSQETKEYSSRLDNLSSILSNSISSTYSWKSCVMKTCQVERENEEDISYSAFSFESSLDLESCSVGGNNTPVVEKRILFDIETSFASFVHNKDFCFLTKEQSPCTAMINTQSDISYKCSHLPNMETKDSSETLCGRISDMLGRSNRCYNLNLGSSNCCCNHDYEYTKSVGEIRQPTVEYYCNICKQRKNDSETTAEYSKADTLCSSNSSVQKP